MIRARLSGLGMYVPEWVVTNDDIAVSLDTTEDRIHKRTGNRERRYAAEGVATSELAVPAADAAIRDAGLARADIDFIIFATLSPDHHFPGASCYFQAHMGMDGVPAMDLRTQCTGFLYGLATAAAFVRSGLYRHVLVVGAEVHSHALDFSREGRDVTVLFGDGAGAAVVSASPEGDPSELKTFHLHADGRHADALVFKVWDIRRKPFIQHEGQVGLTAPDERWPTMNGREVFRHAVLGMREAVQEACAANGLTVADLDLLIPHQANMRINESVAKGLGIPEEKVVHTIQRYGNTTAASIPMAMCAARDEGRLVRGQRVVLVAFGSGFTWGSVHLVY
ncbi:MAG: beta-ketoacyl-ACP synthase III [Pseudomonadota bacterium]